jgi:quinol monooxygenase YgiN
MFTSIRTYRIGRGSVDEVMHRVDRDLADAFAREPGFISYEVVRTGERTLASITTFHESEQAEDSNQLAADWVAEELADFDVERMGVMSGAVMVSRASSDILVPAHH